VITVKVTDNETGRVIFEANNATGIMGVVAIPDRAQGVVHLRNGIPEVYTMLEVLEDMKQDTLNDDVDLYRFAEHMTTHGGAVKINKGEEQ
jgi:hypothetical protein